MCWVVFVFLSFFGGRDVWQDIPKLGRRNEAHPSPFSIVYLILGIPETIGNNVHDVLVGTSNPTSLSKLLLLLLL